MTLPDRPAPMAEKESRAPAVHQRQVRVTAPGHRDARPTESTTEMSHG